jgi:hypothetical protein
MANLTIKDAPIRNAVTGPPSSPRPCEVATCPFCGQEVENDYGAFGSWYVNVCAHFWEFAGPVAIFGRHDDG